MAASLAVLVYLLLVVELVLVVLLCLPTPLFIPKLISSKVIRGKMFVVIFLLCIGLVFVGQFVEMQKYEVRHETATLSTDRERINLARFRAQRDVYLTGFALTLGLIIFRLSYIVNALIALKLQPVSARPAISSTPQAVRQRTE
eukprot:TRINITY_DN487_c0_g1_i4.p3 TRINITY_DN487_c0_g1~~TRINITY_DN487_c0_g1_i4.p3  ORF type:complete len:144 (-),score=18.23 TRINITY_DN487_c0_g1_i4:1145-1576(-)